MRKIYFLLSLLFGIDSYSQDFKDTAFAVRGFTCQCKYNLNIEDDNKIFDRSEKSAYYPGGEEDWNKFVKKNMDTKFKGKDNVEVRFQVDKNGDLSNFLLLNKAPNQKYEEVIRLLKSSGKWFPSLQNGYCVKSYVRLSFEL
jgi:periplasmic protein TonB